MNCVGKWYDIKKNKLSSFTSIQKEREKQEPAWEPNASFGPMPSLLVHQKLRREISQSVFQESGVIVWR